MRGQRTLLSIVAGTLALAAPARAQGNPEYDLVSIPTGMGPIGVAFRALLPGERGKGHTHEFYYAHPIWGHGVQRERLTLDCARLRATARERSFRLWSGGAPVKHEMEFTPVLTLPVFFEDSFASGLAPNIGCSPKGFHPKRLTMTATFAELLRMAGAQRQPRSVVTVEKPHRASVAFPAPPAPFSYPPALVSADYRQQGLSLTRGGVEMRFFGEAHKPGLVEWKDAGQMFGYYLRGVQEHKPLKLLEIANARNRGLVAVARSDGLSTVSRLVICKQPNPRIAYVATADFRNTEQEIEAWRFVNSMQVDC